MPCCSCGLVGQVCVSRTGRTARVISVRGPDLGKVSLPSFSSKETNGSGLLFVAGALFGNDGLLFLLRYSVGFGFVLAGFLVVGLRGTVAHNFDFFSAG